MFKKGTKRYAIGPIFINLLLYLLVGLYLFRQFSALIDWGLEALPSWLTFLVPVAWVLFALIALLATGYSFAIVATIVCSPFHGLLAEKVAENLGYRSFDEKLSLSELRRIAVRAFRREWTKLIYNLPRTLGVLLLALVLGFVPVLNLLAPAVTLLWAAWSMAIQFVDYPADNDKVEFRPMLEQMRKRRKDCLIFGGATAFLLSIPLFNLLVLPAAVAGATKLWIEEIHAR